MLNQMKKKIVVILPRGESIKNFVYSGITDALREDFKVVFFSVVPNLEIKKYLVSKCDDFYELEENTSKNKYADELVKVLQIAHAKNLNSVTKNLKIVKDDILSKKKFRSYLFRKLRKFIAFFYYSQKGLIRLTNHFTKANFNNQKVKEYEFFLKEITPDLVFNTSHIHNVISLDLMYAVKKLKIKSATFLFSWDNLTSQGRILPSYDIYFTWNQKIKEDLLRLYPAIQKQNVFVTGTPQFDFHFNDDFIDSKEKLYDFLKISYDKKIILYSTGMAYYTPKEHVIVKEIEKVLRNINDDLQLVVRIYAKDNNTEYYKLRENNKSIIIPDHFWELNYLTPTIKDITLFNSLINHCSIGINVASTVSLDLAILNKPVINIAFNPPGENIYPNNYEKIYDFDHYKTIIDSGAISLVKNTDELERVIIKYLEQPGWKENERNRLVKDFFEEKLKQNRKQIFSDVITELFR
jgi:hypothetical protein